MPEFELRPVDPETDAALLHAWLTHPKSSFWDMQDATVADVRDAYRQIAAAAGHEALIGSRAGEPVFLMEHYDPRTDPVGDAYDVRDGDRGMHFLVAPADEPEHGFTRAVIERVVAEVLADPRVDRVVVEPDVRNAAVHRLNAAVGFSTARRVRLPDKAALLSFCTRDAFEAATR